MRRKIKRSAANAPPPLPMSERAKSGARRFTRDEVNDQMQAVEQMVLQAHPQRSVVTYMRQRFGVSKTRVITLITRCHAEWAEQDADKRVAWRARMVRNLERKMRETDGRRTPDGKKWIDHPNHIAYARYAALLIDIQGLSAPIEVNLNVAVSEAITMVIAELSSEEVQEAVDRYHEDRKLAQQARLLLVETNGISSAAE